MPAATDQIIDEPAIELEEYDLLNLKIAEKAVMLICPSAENFKISSFKGGTECTCEIVACYVDNKFNAVGARDGERTTVSISISWPKGQSGHGRVEVKVVDGGIYGAMVCYQVGGIAVVRWFDEIPLRTQYLVKYGIASPKGKKIEVTNLFTYIGLALGAIVFHFAQELFHGSWIPPLLLPYLYGSLGALVCIFFVQCSVLWRRREFEDKLEEAWKTEDKRLQK